MPQPPIAATVTAHLSSQVPRAAVRCQTPHHNIDVQYLYNDLAGTPVSQVPYRLTNRQDRSQVYEGVSDNEGRIKKEGLIAGLYDLEFMPEADVVAQQQADKLRAQFKQTLNDMVVSAQQSTRFQEQRLNDLDWAETGLVYTGAFMQGAWDSVTGFAEFVGQAVSILAQANHAYYDIWGDIVTGNFDAIEEKITHSNAAAQRFFAASADNFEKLILLMSDSSVKQALFDFPRKYWDALSSVEQTRALASIGTDIALEIVIAVVSGGLTVPAQIAKIAQSSTRLIQQAINLLDDLVKALKKLKPRKKVQVPVNTPRTYYLKDKPNNHLAINYGGSSQTAGKLDNGKTSASSRNTSKSGEPVSMVTGEELLELTDFTLPGLLPLTWKRFYRSGNDRNQGIGCGWTHVFCEQLTLHKNTVVYQDNEGRYIELPTPDIGEYTVNETEGIYLHREFHHLFIIKQKNQPNKHFTLIGNHQARLHLISNKLGHYWACEYNDQGQLSYLSSSWGATVQINYKNGLITTIALVAQHQIHQLASYHYNEVGDLIAAKDRTQHPEYYQYRNHVLTQRTLKSGYSFYLKWDRYDKFGKCIEQWGDQNNYHYRFEWDEVNQVSKSTDSHGGVLEIHYNSAGLTTQEISPNGHVTLFEYDDSHRLIKKTNPNGHTFEYKYDEHGNLTAFLDPAGGGYSLFYDEDQNPIGYSDALGNTWETEYNDKGLIRKTITPEAHETKYFYNDNGLPITIINPDGNKRFLEWDEQGYLIADSHGQKELTSAGISQYRHDAFGQITEVINGAQRTQYYYDVSGNLTQIQHPDGRSNSLSYNPSGQLTQFTDASGRTTTYEYDGLSQVKKRIDASGHSFHYHYDPERNLVGLTNEKGEHYHLAYDADERLIKEIGFDGRIQQYVYDPAGYLIQHIEGEAETPSPLANITTHYHRDPLGRLLQKQCPDGESINFNYNANGQLIEAINQHRALQFEYTASGQLAKEIQDTHSLTHQYDHFGNRTQSILPNGDVIDYQHDYLGQLEAVHFNQTCISQMSRNAFGQEQRRQQGQLTSQWDYDPMGRLSQHCVANEHTKQTILQRDYHYDANGNLGQIDDLLKGSTAYQYDALNRLKSVAGYANEQFEFDPAGNIINGNTTARGNRLSFYGDKHFQYDSRGNLIEERRGKGQQLITRYHYNSQNQLVRAEKSGQSFSYQYDALGRRISKQDEFGETVFLWNGDVLLQEERKNHKKLYIYEPNSFKPLAHIENNQCYFYHLDHLGTPQEISDWNGRIVWSGKYKAYGNLALKQVEEVENNFRFQGQYYDKETGLHYNRHRYYDPNSARFVNQDPIGLSGGTNNYQYAENPTSWIDPLGLTAKEPNCSASVSKLFKYTNTKEMDPEYRGEELGTAPAWEPFGAKVQYLNEAERQQYKVKVADGLLTDINGMPLDSADTINGKLMFVMDQNGDIYAGPQRIMEFHHSSFLSGNPVATAGELEVAHGQILTHSRKSGHYKPTKEHHEQFTVELNEKGIDLSNAYEDPVD